MIALIALILAAAVGIWAAVERAWPLALLALSVVLLILDPGLPFTIRD